MNLWNIDNQSGLVKSRIAVVWLLAFALLAINVLCSYSSYGGLMFTSAHLNNLALEATLSLPIMSLVLLWLAISPERSRPPLPSPHSIRVARWGILALIPVSAVCLIRLASVPISEESASPPSLVRSVSVDGPPVRIYQNGDFVRKHILIQQERPISQGLIWVSQLYREDDADNVTVEVLDRHHLRCTFPSTEYRKHTDTVVVENP